MLPSLDRISGGLPQPMVMSREGMKSYALPECQQLANKFIVCQEPLHWIYKDDIYPIYSPEEKQNLCMYKDKSDLCLIIIIGIRACNVFLPVGRSRSLAGSQSDIIENFLLNLLLEEKG